MAEPRIAIVIPTCSKDQGLGILAAKTGSGWRALADDLICVEDWNYQATVDGASDVYIISRDRGVAVNTNLGWKMALGRGADYVAMMDMDCSWVEGSLREACIPGHVTVPSLLQFPDAVNIGPMFIVPKEVAGEYGFLDERGGDWKNKWFDADYGIRVFGIMTQVRSLRVDHPGGIITGVKPQQL